ncbi:MAG TPA: hypothetical protein VFK31_09875 [Rhodanobacteraceae bacterium]|nr:hypothetical protein [Rhodanobacteraceae bacterium]
MAAPQNVQTVDVDPGTLVTDDARIPQDVRERFGDYDKKVAAVVPVIGVTREEWWLFDEEGVLVDVLCRQA